MPDALREEVWGFGVGRGTVGGFMIVGMMEDWR